MLPGNYSIEEKAENTEHPPHVPGTHRPLALWNLFPAPSLPGRCLLLEPPCSLPGISSCTWASFSHKAHPKVLSLRSPKAHESNSTLGNFSSLLTQCSLSGESEGGCLGGEPPYTYPQDTLVPRDLHLQPHETLADILKPTFLSWGQWFQRIF